MDQKDRDYISRLFPAILDIQSRPIQDKVYRVWCNAWKRGNFPGIENVHQFEPARDSISYTNVEHTNQVCKVCEKIAAAVREGMKVELNMDYLLAGALLHDVDKIVVFDFRTGGWTEEGRRTPHALMGAAMARAEGLPEEIAHMIEAHSTTFSPGPPKSIEALIVRHADLIIGNGAYLAKGMDMEKVLKESIARLG
jgi:putative nucleotidyltransferase with HDIG domain